MSLPMLISWMLAALAGAIAHEVAHWVVWMLAGRQPLLDLWGLTVVPRAGPTHGTFSDRVAAAAPYVIGVCCCVWGVRIDQPLLVIFGIGMVQLPSAADVAAMRGDVTWAGLAKAQA